MTMNERKLASTEKQLAKLYKSLERYASLFEKKQQKCIKLNCNWSDAEWIQHREANDYTEAQWQAYFDMDVQRSYIDDTKHRIGTLERTLQKQEQKVREENEKDEAFKIEYARLSDAEIKLSQEMAKAEYEAWLKKFKADCLKDGIVVEEARSFMVYGTTPSGKRFSILLNNGWTERSHHCYSVRIEANTIFTSGEFWRAYQTVKNN